MKTIETTAIFKWDITLMARYINHKHENFNPKSKFDLPAWQSNDYGNSILRVCAIYVNFANLQVKHP